MIVRYSGNMGWSIDAVYIYTPMSLLSRVFYIDV